MSARVLIIGASGGIGLALAAAFKEDGHDVTGLSRSADGLDLTDAASVAGHLDALKGPFDQIIVATGALVPPGGAPEKTIKAIEADAMAHLFAVNAIGPALVLRHVPGLLDRRAPGLVAVLSARVGSIGDNKIGGWISYRASKAAVNQIVHTAAIELARTHRQAICVALHPGTVETPFTEAYQDSHRTVPAGEAARNLMSVMDGLTPADSGGFFDYAGNAVAW